MKGMSKTRAAKISNIQAKELNLSPVGEAAGRGDAP